MPLIDLRRNSSDALDPVAKVLRIASTTPLNEPIELLTSIQPIALFRVMENRGFQYVVRRLDGGGWHVTFRREE